MIVPQNDPGVTIIFMVITIIVWALLHVREHS